MEKLLNSSIDLPSNKNLNFLVLYFPVITTVFCLVEIFFFPTFFLANYRSELRFIQTVILLNGVHVAFTYILLYQTQIGRNTLSKILDTDPNFLIKQIGYFSIFFLIFYFLFSKVWQDLFLEKMMFLVFFKLIPLHHTLRQNMGIHRYYTPKNFSNHRALKYAYNFVLAFAIFVSLSGRHDGIINLATLIPFSVNYLYIALILILATFYIKSQKIIMTKDFNLGIYSIRIIPYLLLPFSIFASFAISSNHGIEYAGLYFKHLENENKKLLNFLLGLIALVLIWPFFSHGNKIFYHFMNPHLANILSNITLSIMYSLTFVHYNLDYYLFRKTL